MCDLDGFTVMRCNAHPVELLRAILSIKHPYLAISPIGLCEDPKQQSGANYGTLNLPERRALVIGSGKLHLFSLVIKPCNYIFKESRFEYTFAIVFLFRKRLSVNSCEEETSSL